jgi:hypothetical protein
LVVQRLSVGELLSGNRHEQRLATLMDRSFRDNPTPFLTELEADASDGLCGDFPARFV